MKRFLFAMLLLVWVSSVPVFAQCGQQIDDQANVFGAKAPQVQEAIDRLVSDTGADVHVFTVSSMGNASTFEKYVRHVIETCPAWQGTNGDVKNNLIVIALALKERKTAIIFGSECKPALDSQHQRIQVSNMNPRFKSGDFAGGFVAGLDEINRVAVAFLHPTTSTQQESTPVAIPDTRPASTTNVDFSGLGTFLLWCLIILVGATALYFFYQWFVQFSEMRAERKLAQQKAIRARQKIMERALSSELAVGEVGAEVFSLQQVVSVADATRANEFFSVAESLCKEGMQLHLRLLQTSGDPEKSGLTADQYNDLFREYDEVEQVFVAMDKSLKSAMSEVEKVLRAVESAEVTLKASEVAILETEKSVATAKADGLKVTLAEKAIVEARKFFEEALEFYNRKQYGEFMTKLGVSTDALKRADEILVSALQNRVALGNCLDRIGELMNSAPVAVEQARDTLVAAKEKFNVLDVAIANDYFEQVVKLVTSSEKKWQKCKSLKDDHGLDEVLASAEEVEKLLLEAVAICMIINEFPARIAKLASELDGKVDQAEALVKKLSDFTREHQNELPTAITAKVEQFEVRLRTLTKNVRGSLTGVAESTDTVDTLLSDGKHVLSVVEAAVRKVEQGRARAHERNRSARSKDRSDKKDKSKNGRRSSRESGGLDGATIIAVDSSMDSRDDLDRTSSRSSSYNSGSSSRRDSNYGSSGGGDSDWGSSSSGGGDSSWGGGSSGGSGGGDSSW